MGWRTAICALLVTVVMMPGALEAAENALHLLAAGHSAHTEAVEGHAERGPEHGCTPLMHLCGCHASLASLDASAPHSPPDPERDGITRPNSPPLLRPGFHTGIERPPRA